MSKRRVASPSQVGSRFAVTANSVYRKCGEEFNFKVVEVEGKVYSTAKELTPVFGYAGQEKVTRVLARNAVLTTPIMSLSHNGISLVRDTLELSAHDFATKLIEYHGFLTIALHGKGKTSEFQFYLCRRQTHCNNSRSKSSMAFKQSSSVSDNAWLRIARRTARCMMI